MTDKSMCSGKDCVEKCVNKETERQPKLPQAILREIEKIREGGPGVPTFNGGTSRIAPFAVSALIALVHVLSDRHQPHAVGALYIFPILLSLWIKWDKSSIVVAAICIFLDMLEWRYPIPTICNAISAFVIIVGLVLGIGYRRASRAYLSQREAFIASNKHRMALLERASRDQLTGIMTRDRIQHDLRRAISEDKSNDSPIALIFMDLDNFKGVNDRYGHITGDKLLCAISNRFSGCLRASDSVARLGGDEFAVAIYGFNSEEDILVIVQKLLAVASTPFWIGGQMLSLSASIGISCYPLHSQDYETLVHYADLAMYTSKSDGGNCYHFYEGSMVTSVGR